MSNSTIYFVKYFVCWAILLVVGLQSECAFAWTRARLSSVEVDLRVGKSDTSVFTTQARFEVSGGQFHGFDLAPQAAIELIKEECFAHIEGSVRSHVKIKKLFDGRTRIVLANKKFIREGAVVFTLVHKTNLQQIGALSKVNHRARLDWTPIIWDHGTDSMTVTVTLPKASTAIDYKNEATRDYEVLAHSLSKVTFKKHRTVKWYSMNVVVDFDANLIAFQNHPSISKSNLDGLRPTPIATVGESQPPPRWVQFLPVWISFLGLLLMFAKVKWLSRAHSAVESQFRFMILRHTGMNHRFVLSMLAIGIGLGAQFMGSIAASVPALAIGAALWLVARTEGTLLPRPGGAWRKVTSEEMVQLRSVLRVYKRRRKSWLDVTSFLGIVTFALVSSAAAYGIWVAKGQWPQMGWPMAVNSIIWIFPIWFSFSHAELPVNPTIESFEMLRKWKRGLKQLIGKISPQACAEYWIREDEQGPVEIRLRVHPLPANLTGLEIATEVIKVQTTHRVRKVAILKMKPGTDAARRLAACPNAAEHHLTPDLEQEVIVLRNRRGAKDAGFAPLRNALALIQG